MALNVHKLKLVDNGTKFLVHGYIHYLQSQFILDHEKSESMYSSAKNPFILPSEIIDICLLFCYVMDGFGTCTSKLQISSFDSNLHEHDLISIADSPNGVLAFLSAHATLDIDCGNAQNSRRIFEWSFKVGANGYTIGLHTDAERTDIAIYCFPPRSSGSTDNGDFYAVNDNGYLECSGEDSTEESHNVVSSRQRVFDPRPDKGDVIKMILHVPRKSISFVLNNQEERVVFKTIDTTKTYHMAVALYANGGSAGEYLHLLAFETKFA